MNKYWKNVARDGYEGGHYSVFALKREADGMEALRDCFPNGEADFMNFVLFSTSGVHGTYKTIEHAEAGEIDGEPCGPELTFLIVQPRLVTLRYGNCAPKTPEDFAYLKKLRATSHKEVMEIGS